MTDDTSVSKTHVSRDRRVIISTLWIFATLNYIYADVFTVFFEADALEATLGFGAGAVLAFAVLMETAIVMVLLSRVLAYRANRVANIIAGVIHTVAVAASTFVGTPAPFYAFFAVIEIACTVFIIWYAWTWRRQ
ncbi:DUF6326 family protein [Chloroflexota bacterium]